jgi:hypothetical protein
MSKQPTLPTFGEIVPGAGGRLGAIMRGNLANGQREPDYAIIVLDAPAVLLPWGEYGKEIDGTNSPIDGLRNTQAMAQAGSPAAKHVTALRDGGFEDWYIPARAEYMALYGNVPELFDKNWHWTSTQGSADNAFVQVFEYGLSYWGDKDDERRVRAVRRIPLQHSNA